MNESEYLDWFGYFNDLPIGIMVTDKDYQIVHWNFLLEKKSGIPSSELLGVSLFEAFPNLSDVRYKNRMDNVLKGGPPAHFSSLLNKHFIPIKLADGKLATISTTVKLIEDPKKEKIFLLFGIQDLSEIERRNEEIKNIKKKLFDDVKKSNEALEHFSYIISHDLKTPMRGIGLYLELIREELGEDISAPVDGYLGKIEIILNKTKVLLRDLLEYSRIGRVDLSFEKVDLEHLLGELKEEFNLDFSHQNVDLQLPKGLPLIWCDSLRVLQIFHNLIVNAIKYNSKESKVVKVSFSSHDDFYHFSVEDNGNGLEKVDQDQVFDMFFKKTDKIDDSSGAGLALVKKIVEQHQGTISVKSEVGVGSTFSFTLKKKCP